MTNEEIQKIQQENAELKAQIKFLVNENDEYREVIDDLRNQIKQLETE